MTSNSDTSSHCNSPTTTTATAATTTTTAATTATAATASHSTLPLVTFNGRIDLEHHIHREREYYRDSMDSGLDVNSSAGDMEASKVYIVTILLLIRLFLYSYR